jgi:hypothetical protein
LRFLEQKGHGDCQQNPGGDGHDLDAVEARSAQTLSDEWGHDSRLPNRVDQLVSSNIRQLTCHGRGLTGFDDLRGAEIHRVDTRERSNSRNDGCTQDTDDNDLQMGRAVGTV